ncbi:putative 3-phosphoinositide-dependent protein kinase 1 [Blattamonas nauphoetae]|uniref:non-specific serine/threonine protein kinase n=1 Tax=Blattamonas nauphoetae TaxID=2049346 RepID=A0ABQ9YL90_9EUKA|nr:putative 3-phosphoinositide-dependent protein kinase 1 [Blattamonas nauphoetae]
MSLEQSYLKKAKLMPGDFTFQEILGFGTFSTVYKAIHNPTQQVFAIKKLTKVQLIKNHIEQSAFLERDTLSKYPHPGIIGFYGTFTDQDFLYIILELCNTDLGKFIQKPLSSQFARFYAAEILEAIDHLHSHGIIHRDLKPDNIFLTPKGHIRLGDFGSVLVEGKQDPFATKVPGRSKQLVGTPRYVSPEAIKGQSQTSASDLWAFGLILYFLLTGKHLFNQPTQFLVMCQIQAGQYQLNAVNDEAACDLIRRLVVVNPAERLTMKKIKSHSFFTNITWGTLHIAVPPYMNIPFQPVQQTRAKQQPSQSSRHSNFLASISQSGEPSRAEGLPQSKAVDRNGYASIGPAGMTFLKGNEKDGSEKHRIYPLNLDETSPTVDHSSAVTPAQTLNADNLPGKVQQSSSTQASSGKSEEAPVLSSPYSGSRGSPEQTLSSFDGKAPVGLQVEIPDSFPSQPNQVSPHAPTLTAPHLISVSSPNKGLPSLFQSPSVKHLPTPLQGHATPSTTSVATSETETLSTHSPSVHPAKASTSMKAESVTVSRTSTVTASNDSTLTNLTDNEHQNTQLYSQNHPNVPKLSLGSNNISGGKVRQSQKGREKESQVQGSTAQKKGKMGDSWNENNDEHLTSTLDTSSGEDKEDTHKSGQDLNDSSEDLKSDSEPSWESEEEEEEEEIVQLRRARKLKKQNMERIRKFYPNMHFEVDDIWMDGLMKHIETLENKEKSEREAQLAIEQDPSNQQAAQTSTPEDGKTQLNEESTQTSHAESLSQDEMDEDPALATQHTLNILLHCPSEELFEAVDVILQCSQNESDLQEKDMRMDEEDDDSVNSEHDPDGQEGEDGHLMDSDTSLSDNETDTGRDEALIPSYLLHPNETVLRLGDVEVVSSNIADLNSHLASLPDASGTPQKNILLFAVTSEPRILLFDQTPVSVVSQIPWTLHMTFETIHTNVVVVSNGSLSLNVRFDKGQDKEKTEWLEFLNEIDYQLTVQIEKAYATHFSFKHKRKRHHRTKPVKIEPLPPSDIETIFAE